MKSADLGKMDALHRHRHCIDPLYISILALGTSNRTFVLKQRPINIQMWRIHHCKSCWNVSERETHGFLLFFSVDVSWTYIKHISPTIFIHIRIYNGYILQYLHYPTLNPPFLVLFYHIPTDKPSFSEDLTRISPGRQICPVPAGIQVLRQTCP